MFCSLQTCYFIKQKIFFCWFNYHLSFENQIQGHEHRYEKLCVCVCLRERGGDIERDNFDKNADKNVEQVCVSGVNELFLLFNSDASSNILFWTEMLRPIGEGQIILI